MLSLWVYRVFLRLTPCSPGARCASAINSKPDPRAPVQRIKNSCGAERSGAATQFFVELSRLPGNLEFNQEGLLIQE
jgi:hypothetical protein